MEIQSRHPVTSSGPAATCLQLCRENKLLSQSLYGFYGAKAPPTLPTRYKSGNNMVHSDHKHTHKLWRHQRHKLTWWCVSPGCPQLSGREKDIFRATSASHAVISTIRSFWSDWRAIMSGGKRKGTAFPAQTDRLIIKRACYLCASSHAKAHAAHLRRVHLNRNILLVWTLLGVLLPPACHSPTSSNTAVAISRWFSF